MITTVCFTGHRQIAEEDYPRLHALLESAIEDTIARGARVFRAGGALGFDTLAALAVLRLRKKYDDVKLELCLPCKDQDKKWTLFSKMVYANILRKCDEARYVGEKYTSSCMFERNRMMVNGSHVCVAYYDGGGGGTAYTYSYAQRNRVKIINVYDTLENK